MLRTSTSSSLEGKTSGDEKKSDPEQTTKLEKYKAKIKFSFKPSGDHPRFKALVGVSVPPFHKIGKYKLTGARLIALLKLQNPYNLDMSLMGGWSLHWHHIVIQEFLEMKWSPSEEEIAAIREKAKLIAIPLQQEWCEHNSAVKAMGVSIIPCDKIMLLPKWKEIFSILKARSQDNPDYKSKLDAFRDIFLAKRYPNLVLPKIPHHPEIVKLCYYHMNTYILEEMALFSFFSRYLNENLTQHNSGGYDIFLYPATKQDKRDLAEICLQRSMCFILDSKEQEVPRMRWGDVILNKQKQKQIQSPLSFSPTSSDLSTSEASTSKMPIGEPTTPLSSSPGSEVSLSGSDTDDPSIYFACTCDQKHKTPTSPPISIPTSPLIQRKKLFKDNDSAHSTQSSELVEIFTGIVHKFLNNKDPIFCWIVIESLKKPLKQKDFNNKFFTLCYLFHNLPSHLSSRILTLLITFNSTQKKQEKTGPTITVLESFIFKEVDLQTFKQALMDLLRVLPPNTSLDFIIDCLKNSYSWTLLNAQTDELMAAITQASFFENGLKKQVLPKLLESMLDQLEKKEVKAKSGLGSKRVKKFDDPRILDIFTKIIQNFMIDKPVYFQCIAWGCLKNPDNLLTFDERFRSLISIYSNLGKQQAQINIIFEKLINQTSSKESHFLIETEIAAVSAELAACLLRFLSEFPSLASEDVLPFIFDCCRNRNYWRVLHAGMVTQLEFLSYFDSDFQAKIPKNLEKTGWFEDIVNYIAVGSLSSDDSSKSSSEEKIKTPPLKNSLLSISQSLNQTFLPPSAITTIARKPPEKETPRKNLTPS